MVGASSSRLRDLHRKCSNADYCWETYTAHCCFFKPHVETQSSFPHVRFCLQQNKKAQPREIPALRLARLASAPTGGAVRGAYHRSPAVRDSPVTGSQTRGSGIWTRAATVQWARLREQLQSLTAERLEAVPGSLPIPPFVLSAVLSQTDWLPPGQLPGCELVSCAQGRGNLHAAQDMSDNVTRAEATNPENPPAITGDCGGHAPVLRRPDRPQHQARKRGGGHRNTRSPRSALWLCNVPRAKRLMQPANHSGQGTAMNRPKVRTEGVLSHGLIGWQPGIDAGCRGGRWSLKQPREESQQRDVLTWHRKKMAQERPASRNEQKENHQIATCDMQTQTALPRHACHRLVII